MNERAISKPPNTPPGRDSPPTEVGAAEESTGPGVAITTALGAVVAVGSTTGVGVDAGPVSVQGTRSNSRPNEVIEGGRGQATHFGACGAGAMVRVREKTRQSWK